MGGVAKKHRQAIEQTLPMVSIKGAPPTGWIRTMRQARGVSLRGLGSKVGIAGNSVHVSERREVEGGISIYQLSRFAAALDCDLFYAFVPQQRIIDERAPKLIAELDLEVHMPDNASAVAPDTADAGLFGYASHFTNGVWPFKD